MPEHARSPLSPRKPLSEALLFASNFLRHPNMLGSITTRPQRFSRF